MVETDSAPRPTWGTSWWQSILLGIVLIVAGLFVLRDAVAATVVSAIAVGVALLAAGLFEIVQSFWAPHWSGVLWRLVLGALYAIGGGVLIADPLTASVILTLAFAAALVASGAVRLVLAVRYWERLGWLLSVSGIVGILGGLVIFLKWPLSGLWVFGLAVGADLLLHGAWWVVSGWTAREEPHPLSGSLYEAANLLEAGSRRCGQSPAAISARKANTRTFARIGGCDHSGPRCGDVRLWRRVQCTWLFRTGTRSTRYC